jgi:hypothetical protein
VNGANQKAQRLVLTSAKGEDLGGWCKEAAIDQIASVLLADASAR